jgi:transglutaminase-like putative cysteine protease
VRVAIQHTTRIDYTAPVVEGVMDTRLGPLSDRHQRWEHFELHAQPSAAVRSYSDGFGNAAHLITVVRSHDYVEVVSRSQVQTLLADPFAAPARPPRPLGAAELADYSMPSTLVHRDPALDAMAAPYRLAEPSGAFDAVRALMGLIYEEFSYQQHVTTVTTTVAEVLRERTGVCQDFAHVLIGLCRAIGVPARYVSGYIVESGSQDSQGAAGRAPTPSRGGGASHAWVEAYTPTHGWRGFDPTNNLLASEYHVKMALGRDYRDVPPTRGTFRGAAEERLVVEVAARPRD